MSAWPTGGRKDTSGSSATARPTHSRRPSGSGTRCPAKDRLIGALPAIGSSPAAIFADSGPNSRTGMLLRPVCGWGEAKVGPSPRPHRRRLGTRGGPVPEAKVQFSKYETRGKDYRVCVRETGYVHMRETADPDSRMWSLDWDGSHQRGSSGE